jgi:RNA polymerase sigma factor (sigma-70 family)
MQPRARPILIRRHASDTSGLASTPALECQAIGALALLEVGSRRSRPREDGDGNVLMWSSRLTPVRPQLERQVSSSSEVLFADLQEYARSAKARSRPRLAWRVVQSRFDERGGLVKAQSSDVRVGELGALYRTQAAHLRKILRARFVSSPRNGGNGAGPKSTLAVDDVDDLIQEVFARVLAAGGSSLLDKVREPAAYLVAVARNLVIDSARRHQHLVPIDPSFQSSNLAHLDRARLEELDFHERCVEAVSAYVAGLPPELSAAFDARFKRGMSQRDAATALGVTRRRIRTLEKRLLAGAAGELDFGAAHRHTSLVAASDSDPGSSKGKVLR